MMNRSLSEATRHLARAQDRQVAEVVALIDAMQDRGQADAVIAPLRGRLQRIRPPRRPRFGRILFEPLDPVIVEMRDWKPGSATAPRPALGVFRAMIEASLGSRARELEERVAGYAGHWTDAPAAIGSLIWPVAALCLRNAGDLPAPPDWKAALLPAAAFRPLCSALARVLHHAPAIEAWVVLEAQDQAVSSNQVVEMLFQGADGPGEAEAALLAAVLMTRLPRFTADILRALQSKWPSAVFGASPVVALALGAATSHLRSVEDGIAAAPLPELSREAEQAALLLEAMLKNAGPKRREELERIGRSLELECRERFSDALAVEVVAQACAVGDEEAPQSVPQIEAAARNLRRIQGAARRIGGGSGYEFMLRRAAEAIRDLPGDAKLTAADRIRLAEILAGPDEAMRLFDLG